MRGLSFDIFPGECFGLLGPNGAGKTTTLKILLGLITATAGEVRIGGDQIPRDARNARKRIGVMPQMDNLDPDFTVEENLRVYGRYFGLTAEVLTQRIPALLDMVGLTNKAHSQIGELSGGMKRRLTLARALIHDPEILVLDEPTTGLDPQARHVIWAGLRRLAQQGKTLVLTTHFMEEAERLCDRLVIIDHGKIIAEGSPKALIAEQIEPRVSELDGERIAEWTERYATQCCDRFELADETLYCYHHDSAAIASHLHAYPDVRHVERTANLEDVFIKLTGRELRDN